MDLGVIGLGVMGKNLILNLIEKNYKVSVYNRTSTKTTALIEELNTPSNVKGTYNLKEFVESLLCPRIIIILIQAGQPIDDLLVNLKPYLLSTDVLIDLGNSNYLDTERRMDNSLFIGCGISGGEEGARYGPSLMPGGNVKAWSVVKKIFEDISARSENGDVCVDWIGEGGSGHFVKMVHNGIEYAIMGLFSEIFNFITVELLNSWKETFLNSYLLDIMIKIKERDISRVDDVAGNKGTGLLCIKNAMDCQCPLNMIYEATNSRFLSHDKEKRLKFSGLINKESNKFVIKDSEMTGAMKLVFALAYVQGYELIKRFSLVKGWNLDIKSIKRVWMGGCIIRSKFLTLEVEDECSEEFIKIYKENIDNLRKVCVKFIENGVSAPVFLSALEHLDTLNHERSSGAVIQAMRDFFGRHGLKFIDGKEGHLEDL